MRAILAVLLMAGCGDDGVITAPDASMADGAIAPTCSGLTAEQSLRVPIGECCDESKAALCGGAHNGVCVVDTCMLQCSGHQPACPNGDAQWRTAPDGHQQCVCP